MAAPSGHGLRPPRAARCPFHPYMSNFVAFGRFMRMMRIKYLFASGGITGFGPRSVDPGAVTVMDWPGGFEYYDSNPRSRDYARDARGRALGAGRQG